MSVATLNIPPGVPSDGTVRADFVPDGGFSDYHNPTTAEVTAGTAQNLSCHLFSIGMDATEARNTKRRLCSKQAYEILGQTTWTLEDLSYVYDVQNPSSLTHEAYAALVPGTKGFLVLRYGIDAGTAPDAGDVVDIVPVRLGVQRKQAPAENDELITMQSVVVTGDIAQDVVLTGATIPPTAWAATTAYTEGDTATFSAWGTSGGIGEVVTAGTSDGTAPSDPGLYGYAIDGTAVWRRTS